MEQLSHYQISLTAAEDHNGHKSQIIEFEVNGNQKEGGAKSVNELLIDKAKEKKVSEFQVNVQNTL